MEKTLQNILALCREPALAISQGKISAMNPAAQKQFPNWAEGDRAGARFPAHLLEEPAESFLACVEIDEQHYTMSARRSGKTLLLSFAPPQEEVSQGFLSDSLMSGMLSALFNIQLSAQRLRACLTPPAKDSEKYFSTLLHNYYLLEHKLSNLNAMRQFSENGLIMIPRHTDLVALCRELVDSIDLLTGPSQARITFSCALDALPAAVDTPKIERLLINLLSNALKHTPADGSIRLRLAKSGDNAVLSVDDTGCGIPAEILNNVFHSYARRLDLRDLTAPGTGGLGLSICRSIVEQHGGTLILESRVGEGTSVRVQLPLVQPGGDALHDELPVCETAGMPFLLSELSDVLDRSLYCQTYMD